MDLEDYEVAMGEPEAQEHVAPRQSSLLSCCDVPDELLFEQLPVIMYSRSLYSTRNALLRRRRKCTSSINGIHRLRLDPHSPLSTHQTANTSTQMTQRDPSLHDVSTTQTIRTGLRLVTVPLFGKLHVATSASAWDTSTSNRSFAFRCGTSTESMP